jgi:general secretion pathway protein H
MTRISRAAAEPKASNGYTPNRGSAEHGFTPHRRSAEHGFTLVELLVVLTILGLMSAAVVLAMPGEAAALRQEADAFAARATAAQEQAVLASRSVSLRVDSSGYSFERRSGGNWQPLATHRWREGTTVRPASARIGFDPAGLSDPARLLLERGGESLAVDIAGDGSVHVRPAA